MKNTVTTIDTKEQILNVAEGQFAEKGFSGTTLRGVIREAEVNIAAIHYHFGSKEELFIAVVQRVAKQVVQSQLQQLAKYENLNRTAISRKYSRSIYCSSLANYPTNGKIGINSRSIYGALSYRTLTHTATLE